MKKVVREKKLVLAKESILMLDQGSAKKAAGGLIFLLPATVVIGATIYAISDAYCP